MFVKKIIPELLVSLFFLCCHSLFHRPKISGTNNLVVTEIIFEEIEPGLEHFKSRLLLSENFCVWVMVVTRVIRAGIKTARFSANHKELFNHETA